MSKSKYVDMFLTPVAQVEKNISFKSKEKKERQKFTEDGVYIPYAPERAVDFGLYSTPTKETYERGKVDRAFGMLYNNSIIEGLYNITDDDDSTTFGQGVKQGIREMNPFEDDVSNRKTFSDVLENLGWEDKDPDKLSLSDVGRGVVGFAGDVLLDPLTYINPFSSIAKVVKGTGVGLKGAKALRSLNRVDDISNTLSKIQKGEIPTDSLQGVANVTMADARDVIRELNPAASADEIDGLAEDLLNSFSDKVLKTAKANRGEGFSVGLNHLPFASKVKIGERQLSAFNKELISSEQLRKFGDRTIAPYYNSLAQKARTSRIGRLFSNNSALEFEALQDAKAALSKFGVDLHKVGKTGQTLADNKVYNEAEDIIRPFQEKYSKEEILDFMDMYETKQFQNIFQFKKMKAAFGEKYKMDAVENMKHEVELEYEYVFNTNFKLLDEYSDKAYKMFNRIGKSIPNIFNKLKKNRFAVVEKDLDKIRLDIQEASAYADTLESFLLTFKGREFTENAFAEYKRVHNETQQIVDQLYSITKEVIDGTDLVQHFKSAKIKGLRNKQIRNMFDKFGDRTLRIVYNSPKKLTQVEGIDKHMAQKIHYAFVADKSFISSKKLRNMDAAFEKLSANLEILKRGFTFDLDIGEAYKFGTEFRNQFTDDYFNNAYKSVKDLNEFEFKINDLVDKFVKKEQNDVNGLAYLLYKKIHPNSTLDDIGERLSPVEVATVVRIQSLFGGDARAPRTLEETKHFINDVFEEYMDSHPGKLANQVEELLNRNDGNGYLVVKKLKPRDMHHILGRYAEDIVGSESWKNRYQEISEVVDDFIKVQDEFDEKYVHDFYNTFSDLYSARHISNIMANQEEFNRLMSKAFISEKALPEDVTAFWKWWDDKFEGAFYNEVSIKKMKETQSKYHHGYIPHIIKDEYKAKSTYEDLFAEEFERMNGAFQREVFGDKSNIFKRKRGLDLSITRANKVLKNDVFEDDLHKIFVHRMLFSNRLIFDEFAKNYTVKNFATEISPSSFDNISAEKEAVISYSDVKDFFFKKALNNLKEKHPSSEFNFSEITTEINAVKKEFFSIADDPGVAEVLYSPNNFYQSINKRQAEFLGEGCPVYAMQKDILDRTNELSRVQKAELQSSFLNMYDKFLSLYRVNNTVVTPGFHLQNAISNAYQSYLKIGEAALDWKRIKRADVILKTNDSKQFVTLNGKRYSYEQINRIAVRYGVTDATFHKHELRSNKLNTGLFKGLPPLLDPTNTAEFFLYKMGTKLGSNIEATQRLNMFLSLVDEGRSFEEASSLVDKYLFDYSDLTNFEASVMRRIIPFYTFMRKNLPMELEEMLMQPQTFANIGKLGANFEKTVSGDKYLEENERNEWRQEYIQFGDYGVADQLPYNQIERLEPRKLAGQLTPLIKAPAELSAGEYVYNGIPIDSPLDYLLSQSALTRLKPQYDRKSKHGEEEATVSVISSLFGHPVNKMDGRSSNNRVDR